MNNENATTLQDDYSNLKPSTKEAYEKKCHQLIRRFIRERGTYHHHPSTPLGFANGLIEKKPTISKSSWRLYKAASIYTLSTQFGPSGIQAAKHLQQESQTGALKSGMATSAHKYKCLPPAALKKLLIWIGDQNSEYAKPLQLFLMATTLTGFRPQEWKYAHLVLPHHKKGQTRLIVKNAKDSLDRANGEHRTLYLDKMDQVSFGAIDEFLTWSKEKKNDILWSSLQSSLARLLSEANTALWPRRAKHYTLYSCRHQAAANFKCVYSKAEVAALLGHASEETASLHYGKKRSGQRVLIKGLELSYPKPNPDEVKVVRKKNPKMSKGHCL